MDFVATKDFKSPYVVSTGMPHRPTQIKAKNFKKGEIISGELKDSKGKPAFVLYKGVVVVPLSCVKQIITKDINAGVSNAEGEKETDSKVKVTIDKTKSSKTSKDNVKYFDAVIVGGIVGFAGVYLAEKKGWIPLPTQKNKIIGAVAGALLGAYLVFRFSKK